jgi:RING finger protein 113A
MQSNMTLFSLFDTSAGPLKGTSNVRLNCRFDYQPDVCKDYKETGYCGYGDSCKFMHDRGDYKTGWQLEKEYDEKQRELAKEREAKAFIGVEGGDVEEEDVDNDDDDDDLPFACLICRQDFKHPVVTK